MQENVMAKDQMAKLGMFHIKVCLIIIKVKYVLFLIAVLNIRGTSINENLLSGPDLTNHLVGVLIRFRVGPVAFMANIQAMFYQVKVPGKQRSLLRFL